MPQSSYEVVFSQATVTAHPDGGVEYLRVTAPVGKKPLGAGFFDPWIGSYYGDYPEGNDWVFAFYRRPTDRTVNLYVVCASI